MAATKPINREVHAWRTFTRGLDRELKAMELRQQSLRAELRGLLAERDKATTALVANRSGRGKPLSPRGRRALVARLDSALTRSAILLGEEKALCAALGVRTSNRRAMIAHEGAAT